MRRIRHSYLVVLSLALLPSASDAGYVVGSNYSVVGTNFPTNFNATVTLNGLTKTIDGGLLTVAETIIPEAGGSQWIDFAFQTTNGGPLASNLNATAQIVIENFQVNAPSIQQNVFMYFSINSVPISSGLMNSSGFNNIVEPNPIDPSRGEVFGFTGLQPPTIQTSFTNFFFAALTRPSNCSASTRARRMASTTTSWRRRSRNPPP